ncbi:MAG: hypothetical protein ABJC63_01155 [Gemmatimonadales bacterium]
MRYFTQLLRQSGATIGASGSAEPAGLPVSLSPVAGGGSSFAGGEHSEPLIREVDQERIVARGGGEGDIQRFDAPARSSENVNMQGVSAAASTTHSVITPASAESNASSSRGSLPTTDAANAWPEKKAGARATKSLDLTSVHPLGVDAPARQQIETANAGDNSEERREINSVGSLLDRGRSVGAREGEFNRALADARAWVSTTPSSEDVNAPVEFDAREINAKRRAGAGDAVVHLPDPVFPDRLTQDLHLTIGTIEVIVEGPPSAPIAASTPRPAGAQPADATSMSRRLARHHLRS